MIDKQILLLIAYVFALVGTILLWQFGLPKKNIDSKGTTYLITEQQNEDEKQLWLNYDRFSHLAIALLAFSFILQIISLWTE